MQNTLQEIGGIYKIILIKKNGKEVKYDSTEATRKQFAKYFIDYTLEHNDCLWGFIKEGEYMKQVEKRHIIKLVEVSKAYKNKDADYQEVSAVGNAIETLTEINGSTLVDQVEILLDNNKSIDDICALLPIILTIEII